MTSHLPHRLLALAVVCSAQFLVVLDITIVNVALPAIGDDLGLDAGGLQWVVSAYAVVFGGFLLLAGRISDLHGPRRTFHAGLVLFGVASLLCGLAPSGPALLAARALQGLGGALVSPAALAVLVRTFPDGPARARALGTWGSVGALAAASGVFLGGAVVELASWRWIFLLNVPVVVAATAAAPVARLAGAERGARRPRIDVLTAVLITCGLGALVAALGEAGSRGPGDWLTLTLGAASLALIAACVRRERRAPEPLIPLAVLSSPARLAANGASALVGAIVLASFLLLTLQLQVLLGLSPLAAGAALLAARGTGFAIAPGLARIASRTGGRPLVLGGMLGMAASMLLLARVPADGSYASDVLPGLLVLGLAIPTLFLGTSLVALEGVQPAQSGVASALLTTSQWLGGAIGVALATAVAGPDAAVDRSAALADGVQAGFVLAAGLALAGALIAAWLLREPDAAGQTPARRARIRPFIGRHRPVEQAPRASVAGCP